jgi:catechol 2,3-dioxygenase-like lactoylglutathione lyase family enzyme
VTVILTAQISLISHALRFGSQKINLHDAASPWEPHAAVPQAGTADLCFLTDVPIQDAVNDFRDNGLEILEGGVVVDRIGAVGKLKSIYVRDPDGNLVE